jgi:hypothetical protein
VTREEMVRRLEAGATLSTRSQSTDATYGGLFGGEPDPALVRVPTISEYAIDGEQISDADAAFIREWYTGREHEQ